MYDPVIVGETGQTYDKEAIKQWFEWCKDKHRPLKDALTGVNLKKFPVKIEKK